MSTACIFSLMSFPCEIRAANMPDCGRPGRMFRLGCVHEHVTEHAVCPFHDELLNKGWECVACARFDGHVCPIVAVPVDEMAG
jgi:hypothetical protein